MNLDKLQSEVCDWVRAETEVQKIAVDANLIEESILDSVGFLELVCFIEDLTGQPIDLTAVDPQQISSIAGLCQHVIGGNGAEDTKPEPTADPGLAVRAYSRHAEDYAEEETSSCWGTASEKALEEISAVGSGGVIVDVGCGTGRALARLAQENPRSLCIGIEPADGMRRQAHDLARKHDNLEIAAGRFEALPLANCSVNYLFSLYAFHWVGNPAKAISELSRVLSPGGRMDLYFTGRHTGREFTAKTTPIFLDHMGMNGLLDSTSLRLHMTVEQARADFARAFPEGVTVEETYDTFFDTLDNHWTWWQTRAAAHFERISAESVGACEAKVREAISSLQEERGIPYTVHTLHVQVQA